MSNFLLIGLYLVLSMNEVFTESENEIKRGKYPFVAILYYQDKSILAPSGARFARSAVLVRKDWLVSSSLETNDTKLAFPKKTLIARAGAVNIDANFTFNEDEDEQEREIIKIIRPTNFSASPWWYNDITLLKTLLPFNVTTAVTTTTLSVKPDMEKPCYVLVFTKNLKSTDEKVLMQVSVELSPSSSENCGVFFRNETMICARDSDEKKNPLYDPEYCNGNSGGPLICEGDVIGLQTYIGNTCKAPYLYQSLAAWDDFITCGVEEKCLLTQCANICEVIDKDTDVTVATKNDTTTLTTKPAKDVSMEQSVEDSSDDDHLILPGTTKQAVNTENQKPTPTTSLRAEMTTTAIMESVTTTENEEKYTRYINSQTGWLKENFVEHRNKLDDADDSDKMERKTNVEAQRHELKTKSRSAALGPAKGRATFFRSLAFGVLFKMLYYSL